MSKLKLVRDEIGYWFPIICLAAIFVIVVLAIVFQLDLPPADPGDSTNPRL